MSTIIFGGFGANTGAVLTAVVARACPDEVTASPDPCKTPRRVKRDAAASSSADCKSSPVCSLSAPGPEFSGFSMAVLPKHVKAVG